jgi:hypothetical protein
MHNCSTAYALACRPSTQRPVVPGWTKFGRAANYGGSRRTEALQTFQFQSNLIRAISHFSKCNVVFPRIHTLISCSTINRVLQVFPNLCSRIINRGHTFTPVWKARIFQMCWSFWNAKESNMPPPHVFTPQRVGFISFQNSSMFRKRQLPPPALVTVERPTISIKTIQNVTF